MGAALAFQHDAVDAVAPENMGEQQPGRTAADDRYLGSGCFHFRSAKEIPQKIPAIAKA
jgi:hypothetical protein